MNFVGPFAQAHTNANLFYSGLAHLCACDATVKMLLNIDEDNIKLEAAGESEALTINKLDQVNFMDLLFTNPVIKDA